MDDFSKIIDRLGFHGPSILGVCSIFLLRNQFVYLMVYVIGFMLNIKINEILKLLIKEKRPQGCEEDFKKGDAHYYGMPSGHAQMSFFSVVFIYLVVKNQPLLIWMSLLGWITMFQRYNTKCHSIPQLAIGAISGGCVALFTYWITKYVWKKYIGLF